MKTRSQAPTPEASAAAKGAAAVTANSGQHSGRVNKAKRKTQTPTEITINSRTRSTTFTQTPSPPPPPPPYSLSIHDSDSRLFPTDQRQSENTNMTVAQLNEENWSFGTQIAVLLTEEAKLHAQRAKLCREVAKRVDGVEEARHALLRARRGKMLRDRRSKRAGRTMLRTIWEEEADDEDGEEMVLGVHRERVVGWISSVAFWGLRAAGGLVVAYACYCWLFWPEILRARRARYEALGLWDA